MFRYVTNTLNTDPGRNPGRKGEHMIFTIPGRPAGKARPRFRRTKFGVSTYTTDKTREYEKLVVDCFNKASGNLVETPVRVRILAKFPIPKGWSKNNKAKALKGEIRPTVKPDVDNITKVILDALNGHAFLDDKQVTSCEIEKRYAERPCVVVYIGSDD